APQEGRTMSTPPAPLPAAELALTLQAFAGARMLPRAAYVDADGLAWERAHLFDAGWVCAGRVSDLDHHRDRDAANQKAVRVGATGVLLTCDADGEVHAFANICRHRGHELLPCGAT